MKEHDIIQFLKKQFYFVYPNTKITPIFVKRSVWGRNIRLYTTEDSFNLNWKKIKNIVSEQPKLAFLHIPKTGGTYINQSEAETNQPVISGYKKLGHRYVVTSEGDIKNPLYAHHDHQREYSTLIQYKDISNYIIFSNIRNPFSFLVSYLYHAGFGQTNYLDENHYDYDIAQKGFDYLLKTIADREDIWPNRKFLFPQLFSFNGDFIIDWLNRLETLDEDLKLLAEKYNRKYTQKEKQRIGGHRNYKTYYTDELIDLVYATWGRELSLFGYDFDGFIKNYSSLKGDISPQQKLNIKYFLSNDKLFIEGKEINSRDFSSDTLINLRNL